MPLRSGVIDDELLTAGFDLAAAEKDHGVERHLLAVLAKEQQIARTRPAEIAAHEKRVVAPDVLHVSELRERAVAKIAGFEASAAHPKERSRQRRVRILILLNVAVDAGAGSDMAWAHAALCSRKASR